VHVSTEVPRMACKKITDQDSQVGTAWHGRLAGDVRAGAPSIKSGLLMGMCKSLQTQ
jgi:hypothetical protein